MTTPRKRNRLLAFAAALVLIGITAFGVRYFVATMSTVAPIDSAQYVPDPAAWPPPVADQPVASPVAVPDSIPSPELFPEPDVNSGPDPVPAPAPIPQPTPSLTYSFDPDLAPVRTAATRIFQADSADQRQEAAERCQRGAEALLDRPDATGTTAALYYVGAAPLTNTQGRVAVPPADDVRTVATEDLLLIARLLFNTSRFQPADQLVTLILSRDDELREQGLRLAVAVRFDIGRDRDVLSHCDELIAMHPDSPEFYRVQMMVHRNHGRWDNFIPAAEKARELTEETDWVLLVELADGYTHLGRVEEATEIIHQIQQQRPELLDQAPTMYARWLIQKGETEQARKIIDGLLEQQPDDDEALLMKGKMLVSDGDYAAAVEAFEKLLAVAPSEAQAYYQLGQAHARLGNQDKARTYLEKHRQVLDAKVRLYSLEQQAAAEPHNREIRLEIVKQYKEIGLDELADFWMRSVEQLGVQR